MRSLLLPLLLAGCGAATVPADREEAFTFAVGRLQAGEPLASATAAYEYIRGAGPDDPRHDRALRILALDAEMLGLTYAASLWYLEIAEGRRDPILLPEAVQGLRRIIEGGPHDAETLVDGFIATSEFSGLPFDLQAFVDYHRGLHDARQHLDAWADARFASLDPRSDYQRRGAYVQAVRKVAARDLPGATAALEALLAGATEHPLPPDLAADVERSLARLAMEKGDYTEAIAHYEAVRRLAPGQRAGGDAELLLEMAWAHYHQGDARRALGLLLALDAPIYATLIAPERFLLEALALRRLCQFGPARQAAVRLRARHGEAINDLRRGVAPTASSAVRAAARGRQGLSALSTFVDRLEVEAAQVESNRRRLGDALGDRLTRLYADGMADARRRLEAALGQEADALAAELLASEEDVGLILHELGVGLLRGRRRPPGPAEVAAYEASAGPHSTRFPFTGEFWTDELDDLLVVAEDRCIEE